MINAKVICGNQDVQVPAHLNFGKFMLDRMRCFPDRIALKHGISNEKLTYKEVLQYSVNLAVSLTKLGVGIRDTVALGCEPRIEIMPTIFAVVFTGASCTSLPLDGGRKFHKHKIGIIQPKYFICTSLFWEEFKDILKTFDCIKCFITLDEVTDTCIPIKSLFANDVDINDFEPLKVHGQSDVALILNSSGTTGMPKGILLTHLNCILNSLPDGFIDPSIKITFMTGQWFHNYNIFKTCKIFCAGKTNIFIEELKEDKILKSIEDNKVNLAMLIPGTIESLSKSDIVSQYDVDSLKIIYSRTSPLHKVTIENVKKRFPKLHSVRQGYGLTECGEPTSETWSTKGLKPGSVGMVSPGISIKVVDPQTNEILGPNERGEIRVTGPIFMKGYIGTNPSTYLDEQGFFKTGDLGYYDEENYFYIVDRLNDVIVYNGYKTSGISNAKGSPIRLNKVAIQVPPGPLEAILMTHPNVLEAAVVGKKVPILGEEPTAFVVKETGADVTEKELIDRVAAEVPSYMELKGGVRFVDELPRNPRGKILRSIIKKMLNEGIENSDP